MTAWERAAFALALTSIIGALAFWPVVKRVHPRLAVACASQGDLPPEGPTTPAAGGTAALSTERGDVDPWGSPWHAVVSARARTFTIVVFSPGADGQPGTADDVRCLEAQEGALARAAPEAVLARPATCLAALGLGLAAWTAASRRWSRAPRSSFARELARALGMIALPWMAIAPWLAQEVRAIDDTRFGFVVAPRTALALTWTALLLLPALAWRLSRPREEA